MNERTLRRLLRAVAVIIAILAVIDPAITSNRANRPDVVIESASIGDSALVAQVARKLSSDFTVLRTPYSNAAATVYVGTQIPAPYAPTTARTAPPAFALVPDQSSARVALASLRAPSRAPLNARVPVTARITASRAKGKTVEAELLANGSVVDRMTSVATTDVANVELPLSFVPVATGAVSLRVNVRVLGARESTGADWVVDVQDKKWNVFFYDPRPSWMSTFVRRALERDTRFVVTSRTVTSTNVSTDGGRPPATLGDASALESFDAVVVGAPDALGDHDVDGLTQFMRQRGGGVALLFDDKKDGRYSRLTNSGGWSSATNSTPTVIGGDNTDSVAMRASEWMWPVSIPQSAIVLAWNINAKTREHPMVWQTAVGAGRLLVSGALDAWKFRDPAQSAFEHFWQANIGELADASSPPVEVRLPTAPVAPGSLVRLSLSSRSAMLATLTSARPVQSSASATLHVGENAQFVRVWPDGATGMFVGEFRAPDSAGVYRITGQADGATAEGLLVVQPGAQQWVAPEDTAALAAWAGASGGKLLKASQLNQLPAALNDALRPAFRRVAWHPMRSPWWLAPFVLALAGEWWLRRRRGLA